MAVLTALGALTLFRTGWYWHVNLEPFIFFVPAILFFAFSAVSAVLGISIIIIAMYLSAKLHEISLTYVFWTPLFSAFWFGMVRSLEREKEHFKNQIFSIESKAKKILGSSKQFESDEVSIELDEDSRMAKAAANVFRIENVMMWIVRLTEKILHSFSAYFLLANYETEHLKIISFISKSKFFNPEATIPFQEPGIITWVVHNKRVLRYERLPKDLQYPAYYKAREKILSCLVIPITDEEKVIGIFGVDSKRSHSFEVEEERVCLLISKLIEEIVSIFRNYQKKESYADYMEAFYSTVKQLLETDLDLTTRLNLLIEISKYIKDAEEIAVVAPNEKGVFTIQDAIGTYKSKLKNVEIDSQSILNQLIINKGKTEILTQNEISRCSAGIFSPKEPNLRLQSLMIVPLTLNNRIIGVLTLGSRRKYFFKENDKFIFDTLAAQFGSALENALNANRIRQLAITDGLTQVYNHRYFQDSLHKEIKRSKRSASKCSLLMIDIDHFKKFNDTFGHQAGDEVLKNIAALLKEEARDIDLVARYGGEEFVVLLVDCDIKLACKIAERIRRKCFKKRFEIDGTFQNVTMSIGVACFPDQADTPAQLISAADSALYSAKNNGRNQVQSFSGSGRS